MAKSLNQVLQAPGRLVNLAGGCFALGILLFSGSLYLLTLSGIGGLGIITPFGGLAFLAVVADYAGDDTDESEQDDWTHPLMKRQRLTLVVFVLVWC